VLRVDEFAAVSEQPAVDFGQLVDRTDIAMALIELSADPQDDDLRRQVISRLAVARGWFQNAPSLQVRSAQVHGQGFGRLLEGVFLWRAAGGDDVFTYVVTPNLQAKDLLKADPDLVRALLRCACPAADDAYAQIQNTLWDAMNRLEALATTPVAASVEVGSGDTAVVLEVRGTGGATSVPPLHPDPQTRADRRAHDEKSESERALSDELAQLARKVGTAAVRPASPHQPRQAG
jgi:hypothetical protein